MSRFVRTLALSLILLAVGLGLFLRRRPPSITRLPAQRPVSPRATATAPLPVPSRLGAPQVETIDSGAKLKILQEIFASRNDNDPRLDTEFNQLSPEDKRALRVEYAKLPLEKRNERGTVVFLLGRNLRSAADVDFLRSVVDEKPCLSLGDCAVAPASPTKDADAGLGTDITRAYPQIVALKAAEKYLELNESGELSSNLRALLGAGESSADPTVARFARRILGRLSE